MPGLGLLPGPKVLVLDVLLVVLDLLDDMVVHGVEAPHHRDVEEVRDVAGGGDEEGDGPEALGWGQDLDEELVHLLAPCRGQHAVYEEEDVPGADASPDEDVLDPGEVAHG